jgi:3',5'-cyclic AMP phosphodiesterase CpdA
MLTGLRTAHIFTVPGEHDSIDDAGQKYRSVFGAGTRGDGWYSFDIAGVHVIALVNTLNLKKLGHLGVEQLDFVAKDVAALPSDTPIIVFSHIPLFAMYPDWGWGTDDAAQALSYLRRFSSVTCLNGHVHQVFPRPRAMSRSIAEPRRPIHCLIPEMARRPSRSPCRPANCMTRWASARSATPEAKTLLR